jgi:hypothetical protein
MTTLEAPRPACEPSPARVGHAMSPPRWLATLRLGRREWLRSALGWLAVPALAGPGSAVSPRRPSTDPDPIIVFEMDGGPVFGPARMAIATLERWRAIPHADRPPASLAEDGRHVKFMMDAGAFALLFPEGR